MCSQPPEEECDCEAYDCDEHDYKDVTILLGAVQELPPDRASNMFDRLFDRAEEKYGPYPNFKMVCSNALVIAKPRQDVGTSSRKDQQESSTRRAARARPRGEG